MLLTSAVKHIVIFAFIGWINEFLSWKGFVPLAKLSYCVYLINGTYYSFLTSVSKSFLHS